MVCGEVGKQGRRQSEIAGVTICLRPGLDAKHSLCIAIVIHTLSGACPTHPVNRLPEQLDLAVAALDKDDGGGAPVEAATLWQELAETDAGLAEATADLAEATAEVAEAG